MHVELQDLDAPILPTQGSVEVENKDNMKEVLTCSCLSAGRFLFEFFPVVNSLYYLSSNSNDIAVAAFGLGQSWTRLFGYGFLNGVSQGLETMASQAYGAKEYQQCTIYFYKAICVCFLFMGIIIPLQLFSAELLGYINGDVILLETMNVFTNWSILSILINGIYMCLCTYLNAQQIYHYQTMSQIIQCSLNCVLNHVFIAWLDLDLKGSAISRTISDFCGCMFIIATIYKTNCSEKLYIPFVKEHLSNIIVYFKTIAPIGALLWLEWACFNFFVLQCGFLSNKEQNINVVITDLLILAFALPFGIQIGGTIQVANAMGDSNLAKAKQYAVTTFIILTIQMTITSLLIVFLQNTICDLFTSSIEERIGLKEHLIYLILITAVDGLQIVVSGIARAIGRENIGCLAFIFIYVVIGQPLAHILAFTLGLELSGIYIAIIVSISLYDGLYLWTILTSDWQQLIHEIHDKLKNS